MLLRNPALLRVRNVVRIIVLQRFKEGCIVNGHFFSNSSNCLIASSAIMYIH